MLAYSVPTPPSPVTRTVVTVGGSHSSVVVKSDRNAHTSSTPVEVVMVFSIVGIALRLVGRVSATPAGRGRQVREMTVHYPPPNSGNRGRPGAPPGSRSRGP